jgi:hypothetical protein
MTAPKTMKVTALNSSPPSSTRCVASALLAAGVA